jgi:hypothetical protein
MKISKYYIKQKWRRFLERVSWGRPFKEKLVSIQEPTGLAASGMPRNRIIMSAFDSEIKDLYAWYSILKTEYGCFILRPKDIEVLLDRIVFTYPVLNPRYRINGNMKIYCFDPKNQLVAIHKEFVPLNRDITLTLTYTLNG